MVQIVFTSSGTFADPGDWNAENNKVECVGSGAGGGGAYAGGGGAYALAANVAVNFPQQIIVALNSDSSVGTICLAQGGTAPAGGSQVIPTGFPGGNGSIGGQGGGGAAGPAGNGGDAIGSVSGSANGGTTPGVSADFGASGTEWGLYGCGTGGGALFGGGLYGGGGGGSGGAGTGGLVVITYTPFALPAGAMAMVIG